MANEKEICQVLDLLTTPSKPQIESLDSGARDHHEGLKKVINSKNVVAVGIGEKISKKKRTGKLALMFYVEKKISLKKLRADQVVPPTVPESLSGPVAIPTDVVVLGKLRPEINVARKPIQPGNSIGHVDITAGTLGAIVTDGSKNFILSNSHVLAVSGTAKKGDKIIYPGNADGGNIPADLVANLHNFKKFITGGAFVNKVDCAIAKPISAKSKDIVSTIKGIGVPKGTIKAKRGMKIVKVGRTTGKTIGEVKDVNFRFVLTYDDGVGDVGFTDQVLCSRYTKPGDSGSLVIDQASGKAVGLHFAGANGGSVFNPIDEVLKTLGVKLVTKAIGGNPQAVNKKKKAVKKSRK
jgi:hypothetical protein